MEMEALVFGALTHMAGIRSAVVCVTLLDRLKGDQVTLLEVVVVMVVVLEVVEDKQVLTVIISDNDTKRGVDVVADETDGSGGKVSLQ